ncbi:conserved hypothetical protein [Ruegeria lacuscaerulensis ITI-1157]|nr:conserved hypothetical protein [Ruegeria lacuscaerulensis ITI-1157]
METFPAPDHAGRMQVLRDSLAPPRPLLWRARPEDISAIMESLEPLDPESFVDKLAARRGLRQDALLVRYLKRKTKAASRGAKARRSLGNLYALLVIAEDFRNGRENGSRFTDLLARMRKLPFGSKLQNHPLDNRLNDEFRRQMEVDGDLLPVQATVVDGQKARRISPALLAHDGIPPQEAAAFIVDVVREYIRLITDKQTSYLDEIGAIGDAGELAKFLAKAFEPNSDARLFEIVSYVLLAEHFRGRSVWDHFTVPKSLTTDSVTVSARWPTKRHRSREAIRGALRGNGPRAARSLGPPDSAPGFPMSVRSLRPATYPPSRQ